jgi:hypothetical protein
MVKASNNAGLVSDSVVSDGVIYLMPTGIEKNNTLNELSIYPNPTNDKATISLISNSNEKLNYVLYDALGKQIEQKELFITPGFNNLEINSKQLQLSKGIYFIKLTSGEKEITKKLIIE